jgi:hypothetical protein
MKAFILIIALFSTDAFAAVSAYWDSVAKIKTIIDSEKIEQLGPIYNITADGPMSYLVQADECLAEVNLGKKPQPKGRASGVTYIIKKVEIICDK